MAIENTQNAQNPEEDDEIEVSPFDREATEKLAPLDAGAEKPVQVKEEKEDPVELLQPKAGPKKWVFSSQRFGDHEYVQKPLTFMAKMEFFSLVGEVLDRAMSGPNALQLGNLFSTPTGIRGGDLSPESFREADTFVQAIGKLVQYSPDFLQKSYAIWLGVKPYEREVFYELISAPEDEGGLTDDQGFEILEVFVDQNWKAIEGFFSERIVKLRERVEKHRKGEVALTR